MKTIQQYRDEWAGKQCYEDWHDVITTIGKYSNLMTGVVDEFSKFYAKEVAKEALKNASENVQMEKEKYTDDYIPCRASILNETNIPKL